MGLIPEVDALDRVDYAEIRKLNDALKADPDNGELWMQLAGAVEKPDGEDLNRNSDPAILQAYRATYDAFLMKYPLFYGYWMRYAAAEFKIIGTEQSEFVHLSAPAQMGFQGTDHASQGLRACSRRESAHRPALGRLPRLQDDHVS